jgi:hypothetical protein
MKDGFRELEMKCQLNGHNEVRLTIQNHGKIDVTWDFECPKATIEDDRNNGYSATCNFTKKDCPIYLDLLRQAEEMSDEEYQEIKTKA